MASATGTGGGTELAEVKLRPSSVPSSDDAPLIPVAAAPDHVPITVTPPSNPKPSAATGVSPAGPASGGDGAASRPSIQFWLFSAIVLAIGVAIGLVIGVAVRPSGDTEAPLVTILPALTRPVTALSVIDTTLEWNGVVYPRKSFNASGLSAGGGNIRVINGVACFVVPDITAISSPTQQSQTFAVMNHELAIIYRNRLSLNASETMIHVHGMTGPPAMDGVPLINGLPLAPNTEQLIRYPLFVDPSSGHHNGGTYYIHAHFDTHLNDGLAMPLVIGEPAPIFDAHPSSLVIKPLIDNAQDVVMMLQDFCPVCNDDCGTDYPANVTNPSCLMGPVIRRINGRNGTDPSHHQNDAGSTVCTAEVDVNTRRLDV